jgi:DNA-binding Lrp family transcriptional regulator
VTELDFLDRRLAHALQVDGRASFSRIATVLGVSDQTVARRYARLRSSRALRVVGLTDPETAGEVQWFVRVKATPEAAQTIARALTRRSDTSWVMLLAGGTEIICTVQTRAHARGEDLLLSALPKTAHVLDVQAHCRLHEFFGSRHGAVEKLGLLEPEQIEALSDRRSVGRSSTSVAPLDQIDRTILEQLALDGRCSIERLSGAASTPAATVRRRLDSLRERGVLYFDVELDNRLLDRGVEAVLWVKVQPARLQEAGSALGTHPEVAFAAACTGPASLLAYVSTSDPGSLYAYLTSSVASLPGVLEVESAPVIRVLKGPGALVAP